MARRAIRLEPVTRADVERLNHWLSDEEISESWFGRYSYGNPAHLGYHPEHATHWSDEEWHKTFGNPEHSARIDHRTEFASDDLGRQFFPPPSAAAKQTLPRLDPGGFPRPFHDAGVYSPP